MRKGSTLISEEYIINLDEILKKFNIKFNNFVDMYIDQRELHLVDERHELPPKKCRFGHDIFVSRCSHGHKEEKQ